MKQILPNNNDDEPQTKPKYGNLTLENYATFFNNPNNTSHFTYLHFSQILKMHGFLQPSKKQRRKMIIAEAVGAIDKLMNPNRSTLTEFEISSRKSSVSIDEVDNDLEALQWKDMSVQTFRLFAFEDEDNNNNNDNNGGDCGDGGGGKLVEKSCVNLVEKTQVKRGRKPKQRIVFDPVFATKPRSKKKKKNQKRRSIREITLSSCFVKNSIDE